MTRDWSDSDWHRAMDGKWSSGQILEHLLLTFKRTTKGVRNVMETGRPLGSKPTIRDRVRTLYVAKLGRMPSGHMSPEAVAPKDGLDVDSLRRFYDALVALDSTLSDAERRFGANAKLLDHPILGPLSTKEWRRFHRTHANHHLKQISKAQRQGVSYPTAKQLSH